MSFFVASSTMITRSAVLATAITCRPRPFPWDAPSMIPGRSSSWMLAPLCSITPGMQVSVVNSYEATHDSVLVRVDSKVDLPTEGKPIIATHTHTTHRHHHHHHHHH